jgi:hypothetical protein
MKQIKKLSQYNKDQLYRINEDICDLVIDQLTTDPETDHIPGLDEIELSIDDMKEIEHMILMIINRAKSRVLKQQ